MQDIINREIKDFVKEYIRKKAVRTKWGKPLVGFADPKDPLFRRLKEVVRPSHSMPSELLENAQSVIVYFLPFHKDISRSNKQGFYASKEWAIAYIETNQLIIDINHHLAEVLKDKDYHSTNLPPTHNFETEQLMSDWSHKHVAYIAGLGKFGTHHLLITDKGCCGRLGSIVTDAKIEPTERSDKEYCLYKHNKTCQLCIKKCVTGALTADFFDRHKCYALLLKNAEIYENEGLADVCGKCTCIVPCSFKNPVENILKKEISASQSIGNK